jgi:broad specificity phosphatase PhoE
MHSHFTAVRDQQEPVRAYDLIRHPARGHTTLLLVRHGQTAANLTSRLVGVTDIPLDPLGEIQAREVGSHLGTLEFDALLTSPLLRARQTAEYIARVSGHELEIVPGLSEMNFGDVEGLTLDEAVVQFPEIQPMIDDLDDLDLGWPRGETRRTFDERVTATFLGILERYVGKRVVTVAHGGVIGTFFAQIVGGNPREFARYAVANCSVTQLVVSPDHTEVHFWNDVSHLTDVDIAPWELKLERDR